ncbi:hypothetical protein B0H14DRAFT_3146298 [Mycena olivaceomarginata]|nr:hypothetical protein B0H14DRAFT_3146298 [Mycena olivaceomarginata]
MRCVWREGRIGPSFHASSDSMPWTVELRWCTSIAFRAALCRRRGVRRNERGSLCVLYCATRYPCARWMELALCASVHPENRRGGTQEADKVRMPSQPDPLLRASDLPVLMSRNTVV